MKNNLFLLVAGLVFLASCSTGNFAKRKYTKGKYKPERGDYNVAKNNNKKDDTKYVVKTEKNELKQNYKVDKSKLKKEEIQNTNVVEVAENETNVKANEPIIASNKQEGQLADNIIIQDENQNEEVIVKENTEAAPSTPEPSPASAGEILGYIGFGFGMLAFLMAVLGWLTLGIAYAGLALGIIGLGVSIASWVIDGQSMWNLWGTISSAVAIVLSILWIILIILIF